MYEISKQFEFCASHKLMGLEEGHPCMNVHGHNYKVVVTLQSEKLNKDGFILDYRKFDAFKNLVDSKLDHKHINDVLVGQPSAEKISKYLYNVAKDIFCTKANSHIRIKSVSVSETDKTNAIYHE